MREQTPLTVVAPDGDLIVGLGPDSTRTHTVRVSSHVLKLASPVFRTMLGPSFKEGSTVHNDDTPLDLLHVDPISMLNLFSALHYQPEKVDRAKVDWLQKLVFVCDQYMCIEAMKEYIHFQMCTPVSPIESLLDDLIIAALLGDERGFASASDNVIRVPVCLPEDEGHEDLMKLAPELMLDFVKLYREQARIAYRDLVHNITLKLFESAHIEDSTLCKGLRERLAIFQEMMVKESILVPDCNQDTLLPDMANVLVSEPFVNKGWYSGVDAEIDVDHRCNDYCPSCSVSFGQIARDASIDLAWGKAEQCKACLKCFRARVFKLRHDCTEHQPKPELDADESDGEF